MLRSSCKVGVVEDGVPVAVVVLELMSVLPVGTYAGPLEAVAGVGGSCKQHSHI